MIVQPGERPHVLDGVDDRAVEAELVEQRRPELADERADVAELAAEQVAQVAQLGAGQRWIGLDDPLDVLHLEDRIRQRLGGAVVDFLGEPRPLGLLRLDNDASIGVRVYGIGFHRQTISNTRVGAIADVDLAEALAPGAPASRSSGQCLWSSPSDRTT